MAGDSHRKRRGFSGLADLASEVSGADDIFWSDQASEGKSSSVARVSPSTTKTGLGIEPNRKVATSRPPLYTDSWSGKTYRGVWKWILGASAVVFVIALIGHGMQDTKKPSSNTPSPVPKSYESWPRPSTLEGEIQKGKIRVRELEARIREMDNNLDEYERRLKSCQASGMKDKYNTLVISFNLLVNERNDLYKEYSKLIAEINAKVKLYNSRYR